MNFAKLLIIVFISVPLFSIDIDSKKIAKDVSEKIENIKCNDINNFNDEQLTNILKSYQLGQKDGFGLTLAAIAWQESCAGLIKINGFDPSAGLYHNYVKSVYERHPEIFIPKKNGIKFYQNKIMQMLIQNDVFAASEAISELKLWEKVFKKNYKKIIMGYNRGNSWEKNKKALKSATSYYNNIHTRLKKIDTFFKKYNVYEKMGTSRDIQNI